MLEAAILMSLFTGAQPCDLEDGSEMLGTSAQVCKWDGDEYGNGVGLSYIVLNTDNTDEGMRYVYISDGHVER